MIAYEQDPDVVRWGLHQLMNVCAFPNSSPQCAVTQYDPDWSQVGYVREGYCQQANIENDEVIAYALQEEFSRIADAEASGSFSSGQTSVLSQDWIHLSDRHCGSGCETDQMRADGSGENEENKDSSQIKVDGDEGETHLEDMLDSLDTTDEYCNLDTEVGKRLDQMIPVPHVPKINGEIPTADEEISDHQRLLDRLKLYELVENKVQGDGNCQFRSLSDQLYRSPEHHNFVREQVVNQLKYQPEIYEGYVPMAYGDYLHKMSKNGEWGDHVTLQAAADWFGVKIFVLTSFKDTCYIEILPHVEKSKRVIFVSFWAEVHYNSIYPEGELPVVESYKKKKKWWKL